LGRDLDLHQSLFLCETGHFGEVLMTVKYFLMAVACYLPSLSAEQSVGDSLGEDRGATGSP